MDTQAEAVKAFANKPDIFKVDQIVKLVRETKEVSDWNTQWTSRMSDTLGLTGVVIEVSSKNKYGYMVRFDNQDAASASDYWYPSCALAAAVRAHDEKAFELDDRVTVIRRGDDITGWDGTWIKDMDVTLGQAGYVISLPYKAGGGFLVALDGGKAYFYPSSAIASMKLVHKKAFSVGEKATVWRKLTRDKVSDWDNSWDGAMDKFVRETGTIIADDGRLGYMLEFPGGKDDAYYFPSPSLGLDGMPGPLSGFSGRAPTLNNDAIVKPVKPVDPIKEVEPVKEVKAITIAEKIAALKEKIVAVAAEKTVSKETPKKRVRVGAGPWDAAPCIHLRWQLVVFFRAKLALRVTEVQLPGAGSIKVATCTMYCKKCDKSMTMQAE